MTAKWDAKLSRYRTLAVSSAQCRSGTRAIRGGTMEAVAEFLCRALRTCVPSFVKLDWRPPASINNDPGAAADMTP